METPIGHEILDNRGQSIKTFQEKETKRRGDGQCLM
jgi:hypothetical protein